MRTTSIMLVLALLGAAGVAQAQRHDRYGAPPRDRYGPPTAEENIHYEYADVLRVDPVFEYVRTEHPREECYDERVIYREPRGGDPTGGTIVGAIVGGVIGNQIGSGDGRRAATVAGAVIGGAVGRDVDRNNGPGRSYAGTERRCRVVDGGGYEERQVVAYDIEYRLKGEVYMSRLDYNPGDKLRVRVSVTPAE